MINVFRMKQNKLFKDPLFCCCKLTPSLSVQNLIGRTAIKKQQKYIVYASYVRGHNTISGSNVNLDNVESNKQRPFFPIKNKEKIIPNKKIIKFQLPINDESDTFGNLSENKPMWYPDVLEKPRIDNDLSDDSIIVKNISKCFRKPQEYMLKMKSLVKGKKVKEALDLWVDMQRNFVTPLFSQYTFMIGACGKFGYTEMAFKLLRQMTDRSFNPTSAVLTGLFNACAESPYPEYSLKKARSLKEKIQMKNWKMNQVTYHAMIKAFGKCGDLVTAFEIVDEMSKQGIKIDVETYSFLMMSCINNKEAGFTYAVEVWRKMKIKKCKPNIFTCNLLLRATRDCDIGTDEISSLLLQHWSSYSNRPYGFVTRESLSKEKKPILKLESNQESFTLDTENSEYLSDTDSRNKAEDSSDFKLFSMPKDSKFELENSPIHSVKIQKQESSPTSLLSARPLSGPEILELGNIKTPSDRLSLLGGMDGFLEFMSKEKIKPNMKTLTLLLDCLPSDTESEEKLLSLLDKYNIAPDMMFFNMLIKRRNFRKETESAQNVLVLANKYKVVPDIMTFGVLALGCRTLKQASTLTDEMTKFGICPNIEIVGAMLGNACCTLNFEYMEFVCKTIEVKEIKANEKVLQLLENTLKTCRKKILAMEQDNEVNKVSYQKKLAANYKKFSIFYESWLTKVNAVIEDNPWTQFKTEIIAKEKNE